MEATNAGGVGKIAFFDWPRSFRLRQRMQKLYEVVNKKKKKEQLD